MTWRWWQNNELCLYLVSVCHKEPCFGEFCPNPYEEDANTQRIIRAAKRKLSEQLMAEVEFEREPGPGIYGVQDPASRTRHVGLGIHERAGDGWVAAREPAGGSDAPSTSGLSTPEDEPAPRRSISPRSMESAGSMDEPPSKRSKTS